MHAYICAGCIFSLTWCVSRAWSFDEYGDNADHFFFFLLNSETSYPFLHKLYLLGYSLVYRQSSIVHVRLDITFVIRHYLLKHSYP